MCNLYTVRKSPDEVAAYFGAEVPRPFDQSPETAKGQAGMIVRAHAGGRRVQQLRWGFPRLTATMRATQQAPTAVNLVADLTNPMWSETVRDPRYRCLIPLTAFAEPAGQSGSMTRTWFRVKNEPAFAWAGFCRNTPLWGPVYAGMTSDSNTAVLPFNLRMPVLLQADEWDRWLTCGIDDVIAFQFRQYPADRLDAEHTDELWAQRTKPVAAAKPLRTKPAAVAQPTLFE
jgi:putative SOS response-associated peptidase YedK